MLGKAISGPLFKLLGLDRFTKGKAMSGMARAGRGQNPFDMGVVQVNLQSTVFRNGADR
jgi:palmitoyltransferase